MGALLARRGAGDGKGRILARQLNNDGVAVMRLTGGGWRQSMKLLGPDEDLLAMIRNGVIGRKHELVGPFGPRLVTYADYTASGRSLSFIEHFLREHVLPYYANTHTESSGTGLQTSHFREEARAIIHQAVGASDEDVVIFSGSGATGAIDKLIHILNLRLPADLDQRYALRQQIPVAERPVVFIGPYEHHSNEVSWRETIADVVVIDEDQDGHPDLALLDQALVRWADRPLKIGSFSAASNVTGIATDTGAISALLHRHGAFSFWDYAAAAPYVAIQMSGVHSVAKDGDYKDAVFLSPHKFIGGPGTPGVLVVKKALMKNRVPTIPGGGTVAYVGPNEHRFLIDPVQREEGGTPDIVGAIRAGLVFQLKSAVGSELIRAREEDFLSRAIARFHQHPKLQILGRPGGRRLSIVSFIVRHQDQHLHHNFVVRLLNDLFGIQTRGGCSCAGPYGHRLLGIDELTSQAFSQEIARGCEGIKPGWTRLNFNYFISETVFAYLLDAVTFVADHGWRFLPLYRFSASSGLWEHQGGQPASGMRLADISYGSGKMTFNVVHQTADDSALAAYLDQARTLLAGLRESHLTVEPQTLSEQFEVLRWFPLPHEGCAAAHTASVPVPISASGQENLVLGRSSASPDSNYILSK